MPDSRETGQVEPSTKVTANALTGTECKFFSARTILWHFCFALFWLQTPRALSKFLTNRQTPLVSCFSMLVMLTVLCAP